MATKKLLRQDELAVWQKKNFTKGQTGNCDACPFRLLAGMIEELGELAHPMLKHYQGIRGITEEQMRAQVGDAFGDINVYGCQLLTQLKIDADEAVTKAIDDVLKRDWQADPLTGKTEACHKGGEHEWKEFKKGDYKYKKCAKCEVIDLRPACRNGEEHNWKPMKDKGWRRCTKCQTTVNYDTDK